jgi:hypothetical protein
MRLTLGNKPRLWGVLALTVVAAIAIIVGISSQSDMLHAKEMSAAER